MPAPQAVRVTALGRSELRKSVERMEFHLARGAKGARGVAREVAFMDSLHRQTTRLGGAAMNRAVGSGARRSFGADTLKALQGGNTKTIGRIKSSVLADFSADGLEASRETAALSGEPWVWVANSSACPSCLSEHGEVYSGAMVPLHPSCLCTPGEVGAEGVRPLNEKEIVDMQGKYGDPRYKGAMDALSAGTRTIDSLRAIEGVNRTRKGKDAVAVHRGEGAGRQIALGSADDVAATEAQAAGAKQATDDLAEALLVDEVAVKEAAATARAVRSTAVRNPSEYPALKYPRAADRRKLLDDTFEKLNDAGMPAAQYDTLLAEFTDINLATATKSTKAIAEMGKVTTKITPQGNVKPGTLKLRLQLMRQSDEYSAWVEEANVVYKRDGRTLYGEWLAKNRAPDQWRLATADELADVIVHELAHAADFKASGIANSHWRTAMPAEIWEKVREMGWSGKPPSRTVIKAGDRLLSYDYALSSKDEAFAELHRFYLRGVGQTVGETVPGASGAVDDVVLTAVEWREANPELAAWVKEAIG